MERKFFNLSVCLLVVLSTLAGCESYQKAAFEAVETKTHSAVTAANRDGARHQAFNERIRQGDVNLIFIGDSITQGWEGAGKEVWQKYYGRRKAVNLGISGDRTQHVLWRLENGNIDGISPRVAVVMIGTNNLSGNRNTVEETADGVIAICKKLRGELPRTKILLLGIFPRQQYADELRQKVAATNKIISKIRDGTMIHYVDIGGKFVQRDGSISKEVMPDYLHLSERGYQIWAKAMEPRLMRLMGERWNENIYSRYRRRY
ncbi:MAG: platelet-activating factor acetylhydrolase IB subunit [Planctomycetota bacterium]|jgi:beta-glucosidase